MRDPATPAYLNTTYASKPNQKGGTLIAEDVLARDHAGADFVGPDR